METVNLNNLVEKFNKLPLEEKEYVYSLFQKQLAEAKRNEHFFRAKEALKNLECGNVKKGNIKELYEDLEND